MRSLYWKIFLSFWLATILIILTTAWVTSEIANTSSIPAHEKIVMDSYANAAIATLESGHRDALKNWLFQTGNTKKMKLYLLSIKGDIVGHDQPPEEVLNISKNFTTNVLDDGILKFGSVIVSHEILSTSGNAYRMVAISEKPLAHFVVIPWAGLTLRLLIAVIISGLICYLLSRYLTYPLNSLGHAAQLIARGKLSTRVGYLRGHEHDEIAKLTHEFDRMAEEIETLVHAKERLVSDISHELRSPLARLRVAIELARKKASSHIYPELERMETECERLNTLIGEMLEFARLHHISELSGFSEVNLVDLLQDILYDAQFEFSKTGKRIVIDKLQPAVILADKKLLHRAIENVLRNALHYAKDPGEVIVSTRKNIHKNQYDILIKDDGPGVPYTELENIFNPFYRVDVSREKKTGGTGLGLSIAKEALALHKGHITAENIEPSGLCVTISLILSNSTQDASF